jgi:hypothetical protein
MRSWRDRPICGQSTKALTFILLCHIHVYFTPNMKSYRKRPVCGQSPKGTHCDPDIPHKLISHTLYEELKKQALPWPQYQGINCDPAMSHTLVKHSSYE